MVHIIILAGGKGTRMKSDVPKVLHSVKGISIIKRILSQVTTICPKPTLIVGYKADEVIAATDNAYNYAIQTEQLGTGHAVRCAGTKLRDQKDINTILVLPGDQPFISADTIRHLIDEHTNSKTVITLGTFTVPHFEGNYAVCTHYGRIIRHSDGSMLKIVEFKDATEDEKQSKEVNLSYYCFNSTWLWDNIRALKNDNASHEYYLTDMVSIARSQGLPIATYSIKNMYECLGINTLEQLKLVEDTLN